jgi:hypothetical protein
MAITDKSDLVVVLSHKITSQESCLCSELVKGLKSAGVNGASQVILAVDRTAIGDDEVEQPFPVWVCTFDWMSGSSSKYIPTGDSIVPGNNHFPILDLILAYPTVTRIWCVEYDVFFYGDWGRLFQHFNNSDVDFISSHIEPYSAEADEWGHWTIWHHDEYFPKVKRWRSFNPVYRLSRRACLILDRYLQEGWAGHHEVLIASILSANGYSMADLRDHNFCGLTAATVKTEELSKSSRDLTASWPGERESLRYRPVVEVVDRSGMIQNWLYHPVKYW